MSEINYAYYEYAVAQSSRINFPQHAICCELQIPHNWSIHSANKKVQSREKYTTI